MAKLLFLGPAREAAGAREGDVGGDSVAEVLEQARERYGARFAEVLAVSQVWLNGQPAELDAPVNPYDEVAVLPPVSGG